MGEFCKLLRALVENPCKLSPLVIHQRERDGVIRAYADLVSHAFSFISLFGYDERKREESHDLADSLHNVSGILGDYGAWIEDEKYRDLYIRRFDTRWNTDGFGKEDYLEARINHYKKNRAALISDGIERAVNGATG